MATKKIMVSLPPWLCEATGLGKADNVSGRIQELMIKGMMAEQAEQQRQKALKDAEKAGVATYPASLTSLAFGSLENVLTMRTDGGDW